MASTRGVVGTLVDRLFSWKHGLPAESCNYRVQPVTIPLPDGVSLKADLYQPIDCVLSGTILVRCPYGRAIHMAIASARIFAARGYQVLFVSCRGTFGSTGTFDAGRSEAEDGHRVVAWMREQSWYTGTFATLGLSFLGYTQWALLSDPPKDLVTAIILAGPHDYAKHIWGTGALTLQHLSWSLSMTLQEDGGMWERMQAMKSERKLSKILKRKSVEDALNEHYKGRAQWLSHDLTHSDINAPSWAPLRHSDALEKVKVPILLFGGLHDIFLDQTMEQYRQLSERGCNVALTLGRWSHLEMQDRDTANDTLEWLDEHLAQRERKHRRHPVRVYKTGNASGWVNLPSWPPSTAQYELHLQPDSTLSVTYSPSQFLQSNFEFDPSNPTPSSGGTLMVGGGIQDDTALGRRSDVLTFTSSVFEVPKKIFGRPTLRLRHSSDANSDLFVRLSEVGKNGKSRNITEHYMRLDQVGEAVLTIPLSDTAHETSPGSRLRLVIAGSWFPKYSINPGSNNGTGNLPRALVRHTIYHGADNGSILFLPMAS